MKDTRIALVVQNCPLGAVERNLADTASWVAKAEAADVDIICFPELNITGYGVFEDAGKSALSFPCPEIDAIAGFSGKLVILAGMMEKDEKGRIHAAHFVFSKNKMIGRYRKLHIAPPEAGLFTPGNRIPVFRAGGLTFGIQLCYDAHFPELSTRMALMGADLLFFPHASPRGTPETKYDSWMRHLPARAYDNSLFVAACNQCRENGSLAFPGLAVVIDPSGKKIHAGLSNDPAMQVIDLKKNILEEVRSHPMRFFLPQRRSGLY